MAKRHLPRGTQMKLLISVFSLLLSSHAIAAYSKPAMCTQLIDAGRTQFKAKLKQVYGNPQSKRELECLRNAAYMLSALELSLETNSDFRLLKLFHKGMLSSGALQPYLQTQINKVREQYSDLTCERVKVTGTYWNHNHQKLVRKPLELVLNLEDYNVTVSAGLRSLWVALNLTNPHSSSDLRPWILHDGTLGRYLTDEKCFLETEHPGRRPSESAWHFCSRLVDEKSYLINVSGISPECF